jgi:hypothetical protein
LCCCRHIKNRQNGKQKECSFHCSGFLMNKFSQFVTVALVVITKKFFNNTKSLSLFAHSFFICSF